MSGVDLARTYVRRSGVNVVEMDGELVMMGLEQGEYYGLRGTAVTLWEHLAEPRGVDDLCELISAEYDISPEACRADVAAFLGDTLDRCLIEASDVSAAGLDESAGR